MMKFNKNIEDLSVPGYIDEVCSSLIDIMKYLYEGNGPECEVLPEIGKMIIKLKDPEANYAFAYCVDGSDIKKHGKVVIDSKDDYYSYLEHDYYVHIIDFAEMAVREELDITLFEKEILKADVDCLYNIDFIGHIKGAHLNSHFNKISSCDYTVKDLIDYYLNDTAKSKMFPNVYPYSTLDDYENIKKVLAKYEEYLKEKSVQKKIGTR